MSKNICMNARKRVCKCLKMMKEEVEKRHSLCEKGVYLTNFENLYTQVSLDLLTFNIYLINKKHEKSEEVIRDYLEWWLYERVQKKIWINKKIYDVSTPEKLLNFLIKY